MILYSMAYIWYGFVALVVTTVSGLIVSVITGKQIIISYFIKIQN